MVDLILSLSLVIIRETLDLYFEDKGPGVWCL